MMIIAEKAKTAKVFVFDFSTMWNNLDILILSSKSALAYAFNAVCKWKEFKYKGLATLEKNSQH